MWESYIPVPEGYEAVEPVWKELARAHRFMQSIPAHEMHPANHLVLSGRAFCLAKPGEAYAFYLPAGGSIEVDLPASNQYKAEWFDPRSNAPCEWCNSKRVSGGRSTHEAPDANDWALRIVRTAGGETGTLTAASSTLQALGGIPFQLHLVPCDEGAIAQSEIEIVESPKHGSLVGNTATRTYTPNAGFDGEDCIRWRFKSADRVSNTATITLLVRTREENRPPVALSQTVQTVSGHPLSVNLSFDDPDGPSPHRITIESRPARGKIVGKENDWIYQPQPGFKGVDLFEWTVRDGLGSRSNIARVDIVVR